MAWQTHPDAPLIEALREALLPEPGLEALFLTGSHGRGTADAFSDVDLLALAAPEHHAALAERLLTCLRDGPGLAFSQQLFGGRLTNAITTGWRRVDLLLTPRDDLGPRAQNTITPLRDPAGLHTALPASLPPAVPVPERLTRITNEFLRVLGLLAVGAGRTELVLLIKGLQLLRDMLTDLMLEEIPEPDKGGALHLSRLLPPEDMALLAALPTPGADRAALIAAYGATAEAFLPRARALHTRLGLPWPEAFEKATRNHLSASLGLTIA